MEVNVFPGGRGRPRRTSRARLKDSGLPLGVLGSHGRAVSRGGAGTALGHGGGRTGGKQTRLVRVQTGKCWRAGSHQCACPVVSAALVLGVALFHCFVFACGGLAPESWGPHPLCLPAEGQGCTAYDVAVNSDFYRRMQVGGGAAVRPGQGPLHPRALPHPFSPLSLLEQRFPARACDHHRQGGP